MDEDEVLSPVDEDEEQPDSPSGWATEERTQAQPIYVDTGRGRGVEVQAGSPFAATMERLADEAHYGGYFRVFVNGSEVINPEDSPGTIESGMRIALASYNRGCVPANSGKAEMLILSQAEPVMV